MLVGLVVYDIERGHNFCLQKFLTGLAGLVYFFYVSEVSVKCWSPSHFSGSQVAYTNDICQLKLLSGKVFPADLIAGIPREEDVEKHYIGLKKLKDDQSEQMKGVLLVQVLVAVVGFLILTQVNNDMLFQDYYLGLIMQCFAKNAKEIINKYSLLSHILHIYHETPVAGKFKSGFDLNPI